VASSNQQTYYTDGNNDFQEIDVTGGNSKIGKDRVINCAERLGLLYFADTGNLLYETEHDSATNPVLAKTDDATPKRITDTTVDFTTGDVDTRPQDYAVEIFATNDTDNVTLGVYRIASVQDATNIILESEPNGETSVNYVSYRVIRCPKVFSTKKPDHASEALEPWGCIGTSGTSNVASGTPGSIPLGCPLIALYNDRMVMGGAEAASHVWYMSRQGDLRAWNYGASAFDRQRAVAGVTSDVGKIATPLTAIINHTDDYLLFGCQDSLWVLRGDPAQGGFIDNLSRKIGVIYRNAWCYGPESQTLILSRDGVYELPPGAGSFPQPVSRQKLPKKLRDIDPKRHQVSMQYDTYDRGVHIFVSRLGGEPLNHWWVDWDSRSFWPMSYNYNHDPITSVVYRGLGFGRSDVMMGGRDGHIRRHDHDAVFDDHLDQYPVRSSVSYGPFRLGAGDYVTGKLMELIGSLDQDSGSVRWKLYVGDTHEAVVEIVKNGDAPFAEGIWTPGLNYKARPIARGGSAILQIEDVDGEQWSMERITAVVKAAGRQRLG
jgi:hypothetical protein